MAEFDQRKDWTMGMMFGLAIGDAMGAPIEFEEGRECLIGQTDQLR